MPVKCPFGCGPTRITAAFTHVHTLALSNPSGARDDRETEGLCLAEPLPAPSTYCTAPIVTPELHCIPTLYRWVQTHTHTRNACTFFIDYFGFPSQAGHTASKHRFLKQTAGMQIHTCAHQHSTYYQNAKIVLKTAKLRRSPKQTNKDLLFDMVNCLKRWRKRLESDLASLAFLWAQLASQGL